MGYRMKKKTWTSLKLDFSPNITLRQWQIFVHSMLFLLQLFSFSLSLRLLTAATGQQLYLAWNGHHSLLPPALPASFCSNSSMPADFPDHMAPLNIWMPSGVLITLGLIRNFRKSHLCCVVNEYY